MPGPNDAAGIKVLPHDHGEFPRVRELGISIPTGSHAFVGLRVLQVIQVSKTIIFLAWNVVYLIDQTLTAWCLKHRRKCTPVVNNSGFFKLRQ